MANSGVKAIGVELMRIVLTKYPKLELSLTESLSGATLMRSRRRRRRCRRSRRTEQIVDLEAAAEREQDDEAPQHDQPRLR
jgi:hypothetical protein